ncbi:hypothetical protein MSG28_010991 [Choristoneura fumiferana]|uniref:Uncharacterized protein n=1 Tax=Choristoneura fumiferana TaxID=7141 RepID=A0ACC0KPX5_CHOFU|nr:hypothetical protein MSG28_010991 [Choristoneura fumiferana]
MVTLDLGSKTIYVASDSVLDKLLHEVPLCSVPPGGEVVSGEGVPSSGGGGRDRRRGPAARSPIVTLVKHNPNVVAHFR